MRGGFSVAGVVCALSIGLAGCEGAAAGACSTAGDVAAKMTVLTDDLKKAQSQGKIDTAAAGLIAAKIMEAGTKHGTDGNHRDYCAALDQIRKDTGL